MGHDFIDVTEISGDDVSEEQVQRLCNRYYWASGFTRGKDVVEVACGTGQGLGYLNSVSKSFEAGDYSKPIIQMAKNHYKNRVVIRNFDALDMPYDDYSKDVIILFEAIYYLADFQKFLSECKRILKEDGVLLIATANKDLYDFNPSPHTYEYYGVKELALILTQNGFSAAFWGDTPVNEVSMIQKISRPVKKIAVTLNLVPKSMNAKKILKRFMFGNLIRMPLEITEKTAQRVSPTQISDNMANKTHKVIFCAARLKQQGRGTKQNSSV